MPFSHHSHSGEFCGHAQNTLEEMVQTAISRGMQVFALTEHMPRDDEDLYPEELEAHQTSAGLVALVDRFYAEATRLRAAYAAQIQLLVGFESDWIRPPGSARGVRELLRKHDFDLFVGSVHHVHAIPIDVGQAQYDRARARCGGTDERLFEAYFDQQLDMLRALTPPVVGHVDLIRLRSAEPRRSLRRWEGVWRRLLRNLDYIAEYGGLVELNSAAIRKGLGEPYPQVEICKEFLKRNGRFTLSDDSHGVDQVGLNYHGVLQAIKQAGIERLHYLSPGGQGTDRRFGGTAVAEISVDELSRLPFWSTQL